jgi:hypothetical protein
VLILNHSNEVTTEEVVHGSAGQRAEAAALIFEQEKRKMVGLSTYSMQKKMKMKQVNYSALSFLPVASF